jgi:hypothetical protein
MAGWLRWRRRSLLLLLLAAGVVTACDRLPWIGPQPGEAEIRELIDSLLPRIEELAGLEARDEIRFELRDREEVRAFVEQRITEDTPPEVLEGIRATYVLLGLLPDTLDLRSLLLDLYTEQVVGYYDPQQRRLYLVRGTPRASLRPVLVHELVHALQDQHASLDSLIAHERGNDRQTAAHAALEGHAMMVMQAFLAEQEAGMPIDPLLLPNPAAQMRDAADAQNGQFPVFGRAPAVIRRTLLFPYIAGAGFVHHLWTQGPPRGPRPAPLGALLPQSTQQVLHPEASFTRSREEPVELRWVTEPAWPALYENTAGELETRIYLGEHMGHDAEDAARDWAGDRYRLLETPAGGRALVWHLIWRHGVAADRFANSARRALDVHAGAAGRVDRIQVGSAYGVRIIVTDGSVSPGAVPTGTVAALEP